MTKHLSREQLSELFEIWLTSTNTIIKLTDDMFNLVHSDQVLVKVFVAVPPDTVKVGLVDLDGRDLSTEYYQRTTPIVMVLAAEDKNMVGKTFLVSQEICYDKLNPAWLEFNREMKQRPAPTVEEVPNKYISGLSDWHRYNINLDVFGRTVSDEFKYIYLVPKSFLKLQIDQVNASSRYFESLQVESGDSSMVAEKP
jgi:hypothetical protein